MPPGMGRHAVKDTIARRRGGAVEKSPHTSRQGSEPQPVLSGRLVCQQRGGSLGQDTGLGGVGQGADAPVRQRQLHGYLVAAGGVVNAGHGIGCRQMTRPGGIGRQPQKLAPVQGIACCLICHPVSSNVARGLSIALAACGRGGEGGGGYVVARN